MNRIARIAGCTVLCCGITTAATALAKRSRVENPPPAHGGESPRVVHQAIERQYPDSKYELHKEHQQNGMRIFDADIHTHDGVTSASLTEYGDFLVSGVPTRLMSETGPVHRIIQELFHQPPDAVDEYLHTVYYVWINSGQNHRHSMFQVELDATGRILDIKGSDQLANESAAEAHTAAAPQAVEDTLQRETRRRHDDVRVSDVHAWSGGEGFYIVHFTRGSGTGFLIADEHGNVISSRLPVSVDDVPPPVMKTVENVFKREQINHVERGTQRFYQFEQETGGGPMVVRLAPNGDVLSVRTPNSPDDFQTPALQAGHHHR